MKPASIAVRILNNNNNNNRNLFTIKFASLHFESETVW